MIGVGLLAFLELLAQDTEEALRGVIFETGLEVPMIYLISCSLR